MHFSRMSLASCCFWLRVLLVLVKKRKIINSTYHNPLYWPKCKSTTLKEQTPVEVEEPKRDDGLSITDKDVAELEIPGLANLKQLNTNAYEGNN